MPKQVDRYERRRRIAEAIFEVIGSRGFQAVSLRDVAAQAGVSMGSVQHYFGSKDEMLLFALGYMRERVLTRLQAELEKLGNPSRREVVRAAMRLMLPIDEPSRQEARVNGAFYSLATVTPAYADILRDGYARLLTTSRMQLREAAAAGEIADGIDTDSEAAALFFATQGLIGPMLIGLFSAEDALAVLDHQLDRIFR